MVPTCQKGMFISMACSQTASIILSMLEFKHRCVGLIAGLLFLHINIVLGWGLGWETSMLLKTKDGEIQAQIIWFNTDRNLCFYQTEEGWMDFFTCLFLIWLSRLSDHGGIRSWVSHKRPNWTFQEDRTAWAKPWKREPSYFLGK